MPYISFSRFELEIPQEVVDAVPHRGAADDAISANIDNAEVSSELNRVGPELIRDELRGYGAWGDEELTDEQENRKRLLWVAVLGIREEQEED